MLVNPAKDGAKEDRPLTSNDMEKVLEMQNSAMLRRRLSSFGYPDYGYRSGLNLFPDGRELQNAETMYEQQKLLQNLLKHYQTKLIDESSHWLNAGSMMYPKREDSSEEGRKDDLRKRMKREDDAKVFTKQRKTNFTAKEVETLLECVAKKKEVILFGVAGGKGWAKAWQDIAKIVSQAEGIERSEGDVRKKWTYLKWEAKNTSKPGRDPVSKHVLNILTSRDREVDEAMNMRTNNTDHKEVQQSGGEMGGTSVPNPVSPPAPVIPNQPTPAPQPAKKPHQPPQRPVLPKLAPKSVKSQPPAEVCLRWNSYHSNMQNTFPSLLNNEQFVDVTLACDGRSIKCHKVMLSACSPYLEELLSSNPCQHPIIFLKDMKFWQLAALVDFMYRGEVNVTQDKLPSLLSAAEALQIKGLASPVNPPTPATRSMDPNVLGEIKSEVNEDYMQLSPEIKTEIDDEYTRDTDDSLPPTTPKPKKRKHGDDPQSSPNPANRKKTKDLKDYSRISSSHTPATLEPPTISHRDDPLLENSYQSYAPDSNHTGNGPNDDISIDEEQAQIILERYSQTQQESYSRDGEDLSNCSGRSG